MKVVDMHCDTMWGIYQRRQAGENVGLRSNDLHIDLEKMKAGDYGLQNFAIFTPLDRVDKCLLAFLLQLWQSTVRRMQRFLLCKFWQLNILN